MTLGNAIVDRQQRFSRGQSNVHDASMDERTRSMTRTITARPFLKFGVDIKKDRARNDS